MDLNCHVHSWLQVLEKMAPRGRFELPTFRLTAERSTIELPGNGQARPFNLQQPASYCHSPLFFSSGPTGVQHRDFPEDLGKNPFVLTDSQRLSI